MILQSFVDAVFSFRVVKRLWYSTRARTLTRAPSRVPPYREPRTLIWGHGKQIAGRQPPKILWSYWSGPESPTVKACTRSWSHFCPDYDIHILSERNIAEYLPSFPKLPPTLLPQHISDLIRLMLLERYGGIWMDASIVVTHHLGWITDVIQRTGASLFAFYDEYPMWYRADHRRPVVENACLAAIPASAFVTEWRKRYQACICSNDYHCYYKNTHNYDDLISNFRVQTERRLEYLKAFIASQHTMLEFQHDRLVLSNCEDDFYIVWFNTRRPVNTRQAAEYVLLWKDSQNYQGKLIKLTGGIRKRCDEMVRYKCFSRQTILGRWM